MIVDSLIDIVLPTVAWQPYLCAGFAFDTIPLHW